jgi:hypothetical protein
VYRVRGAELPVDVEDLNAARDQRLPHRLQPHLRRRRNRALCGEVYHSVEVARAENRRNVVRDCPNEQEKGTTRKRRDSTARGQHEVRGLGFRGERSDLRTTSIPRDQNPIPATLNPKPLYLQP